MCIRDREGTDDEDEEEDEEEAGEARDRRRDPESVDAAGPRPDDAPANTPASSSAPTPAATPAKPRVSVAPNGGGQSGGQSGGFFHFMSRSMNGVPLGGVPVEKVGEDQLRLVDSIHALLSEAEAERRRAKEALVASRAEVAALTKELSLIHI